MDMGLACRLPQTLAASALHLDRGRLVVPIAGLVPLTDSRHQVFPSLLLGLDPARAALALGPDADHPPQLRILPNSKD